MVSFRNLAVAAATFLAYVQAAPILPVDGEMTIQGEQGDTIEGSYIVTLMSGLQAQDFDKHIEWVSAAHSKRNVNKRQFKGVETTYTGNYDFNGYAGTFDEATLADIRSHPEVEAVEENKVWSVADVSRLVEKNAVSQSNADWGLGAVSHRQPGATDYVYDTNAGADTYAYIVDSGIRLSHSEFEGRATLGWTAYPGDEDDTLGHGTHVAGTIGGKTFGIAKRASLVSVKVFQGSSGSTATIMNGFNWAANDIITKGRTTKSAINMSLGGSFSAAINKIVDAASSSGVLSIVAAGNEHADASTSSPASAASAVTVGAVNSDWSIASYSNYGKTLDIFGPGTNIKSAWIGSDTDTKTISGTSMATPHIVGLALYAISVDGVSGVDGVTKQLLANATPGKVQGNILESPNLLGNNGNKQE